MEIVDVQQLLAAQGGTGGPLQLSRLGALVPHPQPYSALLCQAHGTIHASDARIGNSDSHTVLPMYRAFLRYAVETQAQLTITPEYSVPWSVIEEIIQGAPRPQQGALWVLGCESITFNEFDALQTAINDIPNVALIHENIDPQQRANTTYVDPLVFVFWATDTAGIDVLCFLIQFKTVPSRDPQHVELQSLYRGTSVYKFTAGTNDVSLIALICSDAFELNDNLVDEHCNNLLLIHIQLTQKPAHIDYAAYRSRLFSVATNNYVELICLNWAANVIFEGNEGTWNSISGSGWYISPRGFEPTDADVNLLHRKGLYYSIVGRRWHCFYLDYAPHAVLLKKQPVYAVGPQAVAPRLPPQVVHRCTWDSQQGAWTTDCPDDGFESFVQQYQALQPMLPQLCAQDPLAVERALELLEGPQGPANDWYALKMLTALKVADEESLRRVTVSLETSPTRQGVEFRRRRARRAQTAVTIPEQQIVWPKPVEDLACGIRFRWSNDEPHCNVEPLAGGNPATFVYLGENVENDTLENVYTKLKKARRKHAFHISEQAGLDPSDPVTFAQDRLCVLYRQNHTLQFYKPTEHASITDAEGVQEDDIAGV